jgi:pSer/pThr/pTyr-binding forkhead associated (FHA) protein
MVDHTDEFAMIVGQGGTLNGQRWPVSKELSIGREANCDIVIPDRQVSRNHARITISNQGIVLEDLGSKNGTNLNGKEIKGQVNLEDGDIIQIALAQEFIFISSDATVPLEGIPPEHTSQTQPKGAIKMDKRSRRVWVNEVEIIPPLSYSQFQMLEIMFENEGQVVSRSDIITKIWGDEQAIDVSEQALDALVRRLRDRLSAIEPNHNFIVTVRGHGLRLENQPG